MERRPEETSETLGQLTEAVEGLDGGLDERVQSVIDALGFPSSLPAQRRSSPPLRISS